MRKTSKQSKFILDKDPKLIKAAIFALIESKEFGKWTIILSSKRTDPPDASNLVSAGEAEWSSKLITIDPKQNTVYELVATLIHELMHILVGERKHATMGDAKVEARILSLEPKVFAVFSPLEITAFLALMFGKVVWDD